MVHHLPTSMVMALLVLLIYLQSLKVGDLANYNNFAFRLNSHGTSKSKESSFANVLSDGGLNKCLPLGNRILLTLPLFFYSQTLDTLKEHGSFVPSTEYKTKG
jgi:hypothetical protein